MSQPDKNVIFKTEIIFQITEYQSVGDFGHQKGFVWILIESWKLPSNQFSETFLLPQEQLYSVAVYILK